MKTTIRVHIVLAIILSIVYAATAQSSATSSKHFDCTNIHQLVLDLGSNVQVKEIKGSRVIVEHTITVQHSTKSSQILTALQASEVFSVKAWSDVTVNQLNIQQAVVNKAIIADKQAATVVHSYVIYKPSNLL